MADLLILICYGALMIILAMSPFFIGFGILFYSIYFFMNGKHRDLFETIYWKMIRVKNAKKEKRKIKNRFKLNGKEILGSDYITVKREGN